jgi:hypothetical protein
VGRLEFKHLLLLLWWRWLLLMLQRLRWLLLLLNCRGQGLQGHNGEYNRLLRLRLSRPQLLLLLHVKQLRGLGRWWRLLLLLLLQSPWC